MIKFGTIVLFLVLLLAVQADKNKIVKLSVIDHPTSRSLEGTRIELAPAAYSSPIDNLNNHIFNIFRANPLDACVKLSDPELNRPAFSEDNPFLIAIDGSAGMCGFKRRIQMAKEVGAKGVIIANLDVDQGMDPYGDFSDQTFLVFFATTTYANDLILGSQFFVGSLSTTNLVPNGNQVEVWMSAISEPSYELMKHWTQTLVEIPAIAQKVNWKPRYAVWGCFEGSIFSQTCANNPEYMSSCACGGYFCSPETQQQSADAVVKEDIRQKIIYSEYPLFYKTYIVQFNNQCLSSFKANNYVEDCALTLMNSLKLDGAKVQRKVDDFMRTCSGDLYESLILDRNRFGQLGYYPALLVNRSPVEIGSKNQLQDQVCRKLGLEQAEGCVAAIRIRILIKTTVGFLFFVVIVGGLAAVGAFLVMWYRKSLRKDMQKEVKMQVSASVEHYFALTESK